MLRALAVVDFHPMVVDVGGLRTQDVKVYHLYVSHKQWHEDETLENTPPKTNMEPENGPLEKEIPFGNHSFSGSMLVFGVRIT